MATKSLYIKLRELTDLMIFGQTFSFRIRDVSTQKRFGINKFGKGLPDSLYRNTRVVVNSKVFTSQKLIQEQDLYSSSSDRDLARTLKLLNISRVSQMLFYL